MNKEQLEELIEQLEKLNGNVEGISEELRDMHNTLDLIKAELKPRQLRRRS